MVMVGWIWPAGLEFNNCGIVDNGRINNMSSVTFEAYILVRLHQCVKM